MFHTYCYLFLLDKRIFTAWKDAETMEKVTVDVKSILTLQIMHINHNIYTAIEYLHIYIIYTI